MTVAISKSTEEIREMPLVELACEILKVKKEPYYFRDLMAEIQQLRGMSDDEVKDVIARLYTEINIDGRFVCIGQNVWGLKRWYPVDKVADRAPSSKKFVRASGDAFSDDDEDLLDDYDEELETEELEDVEDLALVDDETDAFDAAGEDEEEDVDFVDEEEHEDELEELVEEEVDEEED
ncbi:DNA-directed RNA polymerase subunit delta [Alicyclobacillus pomorum]|jgi:DNA-directed RNA polymerase subunit delta|uniref:DNA-directed RNA polymerase subunit delta n=1 Tax=Alicyclobacillus pomorum TaxID=204470 RepID=UPI00041BFD47|nr:DNA-directed RNA polymerase subunit delta [Alicyclobacillus pomorum]